ncbi:30S ribosomal protein S8 [bacterium]|nr:30S ribosomal protein S8 [bacterium]
MAVTDPIADFMTRIRNALMSKHTSVDVPMSIIKLEITKIMKSEGFIRGYKVLDEDGKRDIRVYLKYNPQNKTIINGLKRVSKPGRRVYVSKDKIPRVLSGMGISILSTSKGVLTDNACRQANVGGEVICYIW